MTENQQKYLNYKEQFKRLDRALKCGFNLEAMFIEYSIMEDRSESVLRHSGNFEKYAKKLNGRNASLESKIKEILKCRSNRKDLAYRYFSDGFLDEVLIWKEERNRLVHALLKQNLSSNVLEKLALQGKDYARKFCNKTTNYKRALERKEAKNSATVHI